MTLSIAEEALRSLPEAQISQKIRYTVRRNDGLRWSVDRFQGANTGLILAEVELAGPDQPIDLPWWVGREITFDRRYGNSFLARSPIALAARAA